MVLPQECLFVGLALESFRGGAALHKTLQKKLAVDSFGSIVFGIFDLEVSDQRPQFLRIQFDIKGSFDDLAKLRRRERLAGKCHPASWAQLSCFEIKAKFNEFHKGVVEICMCVNAWMWEKKEGS